MQQALDLPVAPRYSFDTFNACPGNATALEFARRLCLPDEPERLLYLYGETGSGKTHLLHAVGKQLCGETYRIIRPAELVEWSEVDLLDRFADQSVLLVDNLDDFPAGLRTALWELFNCYHLTGRPVAMAGRRPPRELLNLDDHLISRLLWGLVANLDVSDDHSRLMLLAKLAADRQVLLPEEVAHWLLTILPRNVGSLVSACDLLYRAALQQKRKITLRLARELFA